MNSSLDQTRGPVLLHVTRQKNHASIERQGVLPSYSQGKRAWSYYCTPSGLLRVLGHVAQRHKCDIDDLVVFAVEVSPASIKRTRWPYYFGSDQPGNPLCSYTPLEAVELLSGDGRQP